MSWSFLTFGCRVAVNFLRLFLCPSQYFESDFYSLKAAASQTLPDTFDLCATFHLGARGFWTQREPFLWLIYPGFSYLNETLSIKINVLKNYSSNTSLKTYSLLYQRIHCAILQVMNTAKKIHLNLCFHFHNCVCQLVLFVKIILSLSISYFLLS